MALLPRSMIPRNRAAGNWCRLDSRVHGAAGASVYRAHRIQQLGPGASDRSRAPQPIQAHGTLCSKHCSGDAGPANAGLDTVLFM